MDLAQLGDAFVRLTTLDSLLHVAWATLLGIIVGSLPGLTATMGVALLTGWIVVIQERGEGLGALARAHIAEAGVPSEVTAVLLDFRSYDTLLEVAVLVAAVVAIWSLERGRAAVPAPLPVQIEPVLGALVRNVVPLIVLVSVYLVWRGAHAPGGAFQGGALLGGAAVLLLASGAVRVTGRTRQLAHYTIGAGLAGFLAIAIATLALRGALLDYPPAAAYALILGIEALVALLIAAVLADVFVDVPSVRRDEPEAGG
jgi:multisubunit Na+/H+ antiporter MnhB subunit